MSIKVINDNPHIYEATFFGNSGTIETVTVSGLDDAVAIDGTNQQRMDLLLKYSVASGGYVKLELDTDSSGTYAEYWRGYGNGEVFIKNNEASGNGDFRVSFVTQAGSCYVFANKTEGFRLVSPYYRKVSGRRA